MTLREWKSLNKDYKTVIDGVRYGLRLNLSTGATLLEPVDEDAALCPECGSSLHIVEDGAVVEEFHPGYHVAGTPLPRRERITNFAACTGCEFCVEIR